MAKRRGYITGFKERLDEAVYASGYTKAQLAKMCGFDRKVLMSEGSGIPRCGTLPGSPRRKRRRARICLPSAGTWMM